MIGRWCKKCCTTIGSSRIHIKLAGLCDFIWAHFIENVEDLQLIHVHLLDQDNYNARVHINEGAQATSSSKAPDCHAEGVCFKSRPGHRNPEIFWFYTLSPRRHARKAS
jgi:hypothetical protein